MYIQGDLQKVFDALYGLGIIDPVLEKDWVSAFEQLPEFVEELDMAIKIVNSYQSSADELMRELGQVDPTTLEYLAMEVAREFADFHTRENIH